MLACQQFDCGLRYRGLTASERVPVIESSRRARGVDRTQKRERRRPRGQARPDAVCRFEIARDRNGSRDRARTRRRDSMPRQCRKKRSYFSHMIWLSCSWITCTCTRLVRRSWPHSCDRSTHNGSRTEPGARRPINRCIRWHALFLVHTGWHARQCHHFPCVSSHRVAHAPVRAQRAVWRGHYTLSGRERPRHQLQAHFAR